MTEVSRGAKLETRNSKIATRKSERETSFEFRVSNFAFLLEVGCEEIPARFLRDAQRGLGERVQTALMGARLLPEAVVGADREPRNSTSEIRNSKSEDRDVEVAVEVESTLRTYSTPRRLVVYLPAVLARQPDKVEEILGPPVRVAVDEAGKHTRAAESFAQKNSARLEDLARTLTPKGEYLALRKTTQGRPAQEILPEILPGAILGVSFPKSMYWTGKSAPRFVRPIRWVLAVLGEGKRAETVEFEILGMKSGNFTFGHRASGHEPLPVCDFRDYTIKLKQANVEIDFNRRLERVTQGVREVVENANFRSVIDTELEEWIVNSTEWPLPILGNFDERFLHLPRDILVTVMRDHQKYFAVEDRQGNLRPHFVAVLNMESDEKGLIRQGHERVLTARFRDAEFFWNADQRIPLRDRFPLLEKVTYQAKLGSYADKVRRMERVGRGISAVLHNQGRLTESGQNKIGEAIKLAKCDLTTQMVHELPELQGVVGGLYARFQGEDEEIAQAISDHYAPQGISDLVPRTLVGAVVALADKLDAVTSGFVARLVPTGSSDPFGLRRQANGIVRIIVDFSVDDNLRPHVLAIIDAFAYNDPTLQIQTPKANALADDVVGFIRERVGFYLGEAERMEYDVIRAALGARESTWGMENSLIRVVERARALREVKGSAGFLKLCGAAKRIRNILTKSADSPDSLGWNFDQALFETEEERILGQETQSVESQAKTLAGERKFVPALVDMTKLVEPIDRFFDKVLVMAEDRRIRENRLRLLNGLNRIFSAVADLSQLVIE